MIDYKKYLFCNQITNVVSQHPEWAADVIKALVAGVAEAAERNENAKNKMAAQLLLFYLASDGKYQVSETDRASAKSLLIKYFKMPEDGKL